ncbi:hypothetical protein BpHYR1_023129, partial [Brachionus plicatilis]
MDQRVSFRRATVQVSKRYEGRSEIKKWIQIWNKLGETNPKMHKKSKEHVFENWPKVVMERNWKKVQRCESSFLIGYPTRHQPSLCD